MYYESFSDVQKCFPRLLTIQIFCLFSDVTHISNIILKEKNESGIVKVDYTENITHNETRLLRSCHLSVIVDNF